MHVSSSKQKTERGEQPENAYEIRVRGQLSDAVVSGLGAERQGGSDTSLLVDVRDQAELHAFMDRLEDFGLEVISINPGRARKR